MQVAVGSVHGTQLSGQVLHLTWIVFHGVYLLELLILLAIDTMVAFHICVQRVVLCLKLSQFGHKLIHFVIADSRGILPMLLAAQ